MHCILVMICCGICLAYILMIFAFIIGIRKLQKIKIDSYKSQHFVNGISIIVPFRNEENRIHLLLNAVNNLLLPEIPVEIIYVDDNSNDNSRLIIQQFHVTSRSDIAFKIIDSTGTGKKMAQFTGAKNAKFDYMALIDSDCSPSPQWLKVMLSLIDDKTLMICGLTDYSPNYNSTIQKFFRIEHIALILCGIGAFGIKQPIYCSAANIFVRKDFYLQMQQDIYKNNTASGDDVFLLHAALAKGFNKNINICLDNKAIVYTMLPSSLNEFIKQRIRWGAKARFYRSGFSVFVVIITTLFNLILSSMIIVSFFIPKLFIYLLITLLVKTVAESILFFKGNRIFNENFLQFKQIQWQIVHIFYITITSILAIVSKKYNISEQWR